MSAMRKIRRFVRNDERGVTYVNTLEVKRDDGTTVRRGLETHIAVPDAPGKERADAIQKLREAFADMEQQHTDPGGDRADAVQAIEQEMAE